MRFLFVCCTGLGPLPLNIKDLLNNLINLMLIKENVKNDKKLAMKAKIKHVGCSLVAYIINNQRTRCPK